MPEPADEGLYLHVHPQSFRQLILPGKAKCLYPSLHVVFEFSICQHSRRVCRKNTDLLICLCCFDQDIEHRRFDTKSFIHQNKIITADFLRSGDI